MRHFKVIFIQISADIINVSYRKKYNDKVILYLVPVGKSSPPLTRRSATVCVIDPEAGRVQCLAQGHFSRVDVC